MKKSEVIGLSNEDFENLLVSWRRAHKKPLPLWVQEEIDRRDAIKTELLFEEHYNKTFPKQQRLVELAKTIHLLQMQPTVNQAVIDGLVQEYQHLQASLC